MAKNEAANRDARLHFTYRQEVVVEEFGAGKSPGGRFREVRDIVFSPAAERSEKIVGATQNNLQRLRLTEEDFRDIRDVQPFLFTPDLLWLYQVTPRGEETLDGVECWLLEVKPRQVLDEQRLFEGLLWVGKSEEVVVRSQGKAVPDLLGSKTENLFPRFTTVRAKVDGKHWFPVFTHADDTLPFRAGPLRMRMQIRYTDYQRFSADSKIEFKE